MSIISDFTVYGYIHNGYKTAADLILFFPCCDWEFEFFAIFLYTENALNLRALVILSRNARLKTSLGAIMSRDLSWSNHVNASVNKANKVLGLLKRTVGSKNRQIFSAL